jgi:hypothetical protein
MLDFGSSLVDLAVYRETRMGRKVLMDFNRNPEPVPGDAPRSTTLMQMSGPISKTMAPSWASRLSGSQR